MRRGKPPRHHTPLRGGASPKRRGIAARAKLPKRKKRSASEFARIYGSRARVAFVKSLRCIAARRGCVGPIQNCHIETGGMGRKADYDKIVPACQWHHDEMHHGVRTFAAKYRLDLPALAAETERRWQEHLTRSAAA